jgi:hypothetical protein
MAGSHMILIRHGLKCVLGGKVETTFSTQSQKLAVKLDVKHPITPVSSLAAPRHNPELFRIPIDIDD